MRVTGSLQEKNGIFQMVVRFKDSNGKTKQKSKSTGIRVKGKNSRETRSNKLNADRMLAEYVSELARYSSYGGDKDLLTCIEDWLERKKMQIRADTYESYMCNFSVHIKPYFMLMKLKFGDVTPRDIQQYINVKLEEGLSVQSIRKHMVVLNGPYREAISLGELVFNPCANVSVKSNDEEHFQGTAYDVLTSQKLLMVVKGDPIETPVYLGLYLGLRRSEVAGLRWKDIDFENGIVHIRNTVVRFSTISEAEKTKNRTSRRDLFLPNGLKAYLELLKQEVIGRRQDYGLPFSDNDRICEWPDGTPYKPDYISRRFNRLLILNAMPIIRFHDLRHTSGSLLINEGQSIKHVQEFLGHKKASTTLDIYSHISVEGKKDTANKLDDLLSRSKPG